MVVIPFLDHLITELTSRFDAHAKKASMIQGLLPVRITSESSVLDIEEAIEFYKDDLYLMQTSLMKNFTFGNVDGCQFLCRAGHSP